MGIEFDLIVCDEAHRTTGVTLSDEDESSFVKVHNNEFLRAKKRLYMTATPRLFSDSAKIKAKEKDAELCSMDDEEIYGKEIYRLGFGQAVNEGLLSDYKVLVLTLSDMEISPSIQNMVADRDNTINADDASKLIGCVNALSKQILGDNGVIKDTDPLPMKRAVAFCQNIAASKKITEYFNTVPEKYIADQPPEKQAKITNVKSMHIDGSMSSTTRDGLIRWLKTDSEECRILTNVRCLSEGVDVPSLDAVMFLSARNSQIDVVQSVGRVMRTAPGKKYGYIIIPVVVPSDISPDKALDDNDRFKVVWTVLNALRAHDDRFNATVNKIGVNKKRPVNIIVGGIPNDEYDGDDSDENSAKRRDIQSKLLLQFEQLQDTIYARMVLKVGDRQYWEAWAKDVAEIAEKQIGRIKNLVKNPDVTKVFAEFVQSLKNNINDSIDDDQAIEMLSQHMITKPVFEALFENYSFAENNPVSKSMQKMIDILEENSFYKDTESLSKFYNSVRDTVQGIDNPEGRQAVIVRLYDNFFKNAFPRMVEQLGIVYTPVEVVDFILHSVDDVLKKEFGRSLSDENVNILDPFTGTGTFITRLIESDLIADKDLQRKYSKEIFANEIVLLAYYIAAVNIENAYHSRIGENTAYQEFNGICLTDTFQMREFKKGEHIASEFFPKNSERVELQNNTSITVIVGNPPYSMGQKNENDNAQNMKYPKLEKRIEETYVVESVASNKKPLHDSYIKAFRWATDRINKEKGIICFVSNGGWLDGNAMDGFRKHLEKDFSSIYVFNLRGNARTSGELRRMEKDNVFGQGTRTPVTITLLVRKPASENEKAVIHYHDIGDYLTREQKLSIIKNFGSITNHEMKWDILKPNKEGDWINKRNPIFDMYIPIGDKKGKEELTSFFNPSYSLGLASGRDAWCYNSSKSQLVEKIKMSIDYYNSEVESFKVAKSKNSKLIAEDFVSYDSTKFSWAVQQRKDLQDGIKYTLNNNSFVESMYRPYFKQYAYFNRQMNNRVYQLPKFFPTKESENLVICISGIGNNKEFSALILDKLPDLSIVGASQCFPLYYYESKNGYEIKAIDSAQTALFAVAEENEPNYTRKDGISDFILDKAQTQYKDRSITKEDIFYYVYGILHSNDYKTTFANDLKKMLARIPLVKSKDDFFAFSRAGRALADLHLNYETVPPYPDVEVIGAEFDNFRVTQMKFVKKGDKSRIIYNNSITIANIPEKAYEYVVNGKSAIEWIMERYCVSIDKDSGIKNDANDWAAEVGNERYILDLLLSVINVSVQTVDIVNGLPKLKFN
ncbi:type ISP restriction/modification enzyme [Methanomicrobium mobile]|uniref:type ISP restriction/modification enzyme n=1 Tax=Methanomicrobium mobile TaxID=2205 RepID=UPI00316AE65C